MFDYLEEHIKESIKIKKNILIDQKLIDIIKTVAQRAIEVYQNGNTILLAGNGGSAADAQHIAGELVNKFYIDRRALSAIALTTDTSVLTAIGNDYGFENIFARQLQANGKKGDMFIGITTSGNSENIIKAFEECKKKGIISVGLTGKSGGKIEGVCDYCIKVPSNETPRIQEAHIMIGHSICAIIEKELFGAEAIILAGGLGTRLGKVVSDRPKSMALINGKPILWYILESLSNQNIRNVILAVGYKYEVIKDYFGNQYNNMNIFYSIEDEPLDTGGAIKKAFEMVTNDNIFIINGDTFFDVNLQQLLNNHLSFAGEMTIALKAMKEIDRYGTVTLSNRRIISFAEKCYKHEGYINGGIYIANRTLFDKFNMPRKFSLEDDFITKYIDSLKLSGYISDTFFIDIGTPEDYERAKIELPKYWKANYIK